MTEASSDLRFDDPIPVCPVRGSVLYPSMVMPIDAGRAISIRAINTALDRDRTIVIVSQRQRETEEPTPEDLYDVGTVCTIMRMKKNPDGSIQMLVRAIGRVRIEAYHPSAGLIEADLIPFEWMTVIPPSSRPASASSRRSSANSSRVAAEGFRPRLRNSS